MAFLYSFSFVVVFKLIFIKYLDITCRICKNLEQYTLTEKTKSISEHMVWPFPVICETHCDVSRHKLHVFIAITVNY